MYRQRTRQLATWTCAAAEGRAPISASLDGSEEFFFFQEIRTNTPLTGDGFQPSESVFVLSPILFGTHKIALLFLKFLSGDL